MEFCAGDPATSLSTSPSSAHQHGTIAHPSTLHFTASPAHQWIESHLRANYDDVYLRKWVADVSLPLWLTWNEISMETQFRESSCWGWWQWHPIRDAHVWWINGKCVPMSIDPSEAEGAATMTQRFWSTNWLGSHMCPPFACQALYLEEGFLWRQLHEPVRSDWVGWPSQLVGRAQSRTRSIVCRWHCN